MQGNNTTLHNMKKIAIAVIIISSFLRVQAQSVEVVQGSSYKQAVGVKLPLGFSATYKKFISSTNNIEAEATYWNKGFRAALLYEFNFYSFPSVPNLSWFVGPGAHVGFWKSQYQKTYNSKADLGIDGIIGLDYKFDNLPINVSLDWQPSITLLGDAAFIPAYGGLGVRYTF